MLFRRWADHDIAIRLHLIHRIYRKLARRLVADYLAGAGAKIVVINHPIFRLTFRAVLCLVILAIICRNPYFFVLRLILMADERFEGLSCVSLEDAVNRDQDGMGAKQLLLVNRSIFTTILNTLIVFF